MQRKMLCKAGKWRASEAGWEYCWPNKGKRESVLNGEGLCGHFAALRQLLLSMISTFQVPAASQTSNSQIPHDALQTERRTAQRWLRRGRYKNSELQSFPSCFPDSFLGWRSPTSNIYLLLKTLTNNLPSRQNAYRTPILEMLRTVVMELQFWLAC